MQSSSLRGTLYNVADVMYATARETFLCSSALPTQIKALYHPLARSQENGDGGNTGELTLSKVSKQPVLLNARDEAGNDDVAGTWQDAVLDEKRQQVMTVAMLSENESGSPADDVLSNTCEMEIVSLFVKGVAFFPENSCTRGSLAKLA